MTSTWKWQRATGVPLMIAALAFLVAYAVPIIDPEVPRWVMRACRWITWGTWVVFILDYLVQFFLAEDRRRFFVRHLPDLGVLALPLLRPLRLLRLVALLEVLNRRATSGLRGRVAVYVVGGSSLLAFCAALAVLDAERGHPQANIHSFGDAMWWSVTTMTTVGYGDRYPITATGRIAAVALMIGGVALLGTVTASLASWLVEHVAGAEKRQTEDLHAEVAALHAKVDLLLQHASITGADNQAAPLPNPDA